MSINPVNIFFLKDTTTGKPTTGKPTTGKPTTGKPTTGKPTIGKPTIGKPTIGKPTIGKPTIGKPTIGKPTIGKPTTECIICLDAYPLMNIIENNMCPCKYYYHNECLQKTSKPHKCVLCRKNITLLQNSITRQLDADETNDYDCVYTILIILLVLAIIIIVTFLNIWG
jgi:hypothetical protein